ncbi:MAG: hypothetical protein WAK17_24970 [Candidatus Nitrosopolaris sp.]|jgi:hypothetical protein
MRCPSQETHDIEPEKKSGMSQHLNYPIIRHIYLVWYTIISIEYQYARGIYRIPPYHPAVCSRGIEKELSKRRQEETLFKSETGKIATEKKWKKEEMRVASVDDRIIFPP